MKKIDKGITLGTLSISIISMSIILILALIKIYLSNHIYYKSREINHIEAEVAALREEHRILQMNVEELKYKGEVTDTIFSMDEERNSSINTNKSITSSIPSKKRINPKELWND